MPSAFVNTNVDEEVIMVLKGELAEMMIQIAPKVYRKYVSVDKKGTKILCETTEGTVQVDAGKPAVLSEAEKRAGGLQI